MFESVHRFASGPPPSATSRTGGSILYFFVPEPVPFLVELPVDPVPEPEPLSTEEPEPVVDEADPAGAGEPVPIDEPEPVEPEPVEPEPIEPELGIPLAPCPAPPLDGLIELPLPEGPMLGSEEEPEVVVFCVPEDGVCGVRSSLPPHATTEATNAHVSSEMVFMAAPLQHVHHARGGGAHVHRALPGLGAVSPASPPVVAGVVWRACVDAVRVAVLSA